MRLSPAASSLYKPEGNQWCQVYSNSSSLSCFSTQWIHWCEGSFRTLDWKSWGSSCCCPLGALCGFSSAHRICYSFTGEDEHLSPHLQPANARNYCSAWASDGAWGWGPSVLEAPPPSQSHHHWLLSWYRMIVSSYSLLMPLCHQNLSSWGRS